MRSNEGYLAGASPAGFVAKILHYLSRLNLEFQEVDKKASDVCKHWCCTWGIVQKKLCKVSNLSVSISRPPS